MEDFNFKLTWFYCFKVTVQLSHLINALKGSVSSSTSASHKHRENTTEPDQNSTEVSECIQCNHKHDSRCCGNSQGLKIVPMSPSSVISSFVVMYWEAVMEIDGFRSDRYRDRSVEWSGGEASAQCDSQWIFFTPGDSTQCLEDFPSLIRFLFSQQTWWDRYIIQFRSIISLGVELCNFLI